MVSTRTPRQIDADLAEQVKLRRECRDKIARLSGKVIEATASIDVLLAERSHAVTAGSLATAYYALTRAEVEGG